MWKLTLTEIWWARQNHLIILTLLILLVFIDTNKPKFNIKSERKKQKGTLNVDSFFLIILVWRQNNILRHKGVPSLQRCYSTWCLGFDSEWISAHLTCESLHQPRDGLHIALSRRSVAIQPHCAALLWHWSQWQSSDQSSDFTLFFYSILDTTHNWVESQKSQKLTRYNFITDIRASWYIREPEHFTICYSSSHCLIQV